MTNRIQELKEQSFEIVKKANAFITIGITLEVIRNGKKATALKHSCFFHDSAQAITLRRQLLFHAESIKQLLLEYGIKEEDL